jgi:diguanylate cyclase (GGDEF)-like protein
MSSLGFAVDLNRSLMSEREIQFSFLSTLVQVVGIMLVAGLLLPMTRAIPGRFLKYWSLGWASLTLALFSLLGSTWLPAGWLPATVFLVGYCLAEYLFGFLLWAGCREFATGHPLRPVHCLGLVPLGVFGVMAPLLLGSLRQLFPFHSVVVGFLFLFALLSTRQFPVGTHTPRTGLWLLRLALGGLCLLFWHYTLVSGYVTFMDPAPLPTYLAFSSLFDVLLETVLAFGMVVLATDRITGELAEKNRQLAAATEELAHAARTDALTGLLNRRAFDELLHEQAGKPFAGSLAVLDLNDLKPLNDRHGHVAGDVALQLVARALRVHFRVTDPLFRTGGDEFVVVMVGCSPADLTARMARIDESLRGQRLPGVPTPLDLVVAWGVAGFDSAALLNTAFHAADEAMYLRKRSLKSAARATALTET